MVVVFVTACGGGATRKALPAPASLSFVDVPAPFAVAGEPLQVRVDVLDATGARVTSDDPGWLVTLVLESTDGQPPRKLAQAETVGGVSTAFDKAVIDVAASGYVLTATADGLSPARSAPFEVRAASVSSDFTRVIATPRSLRADGVATTAITVDFRDAFNNPISAEEVGMRLAADAPLSAEGWYFSQHIRDDGLLEGSLATVVGGTVTLSVTSLGDYGTPFVIVGPKVQFAAGPPDPAQSTAMIPDRVYIGDLSGLSVSLKGASGLPLGGLLLEVEVAGAGGLAVVSGGPAETDFQGQAWAPLYAESPGMVTVTARVVDQSRTIDVVIGSADVMVVGPGG
jgi:hypothetical protein